MAVWTKQEDSDANGNHRSTAKGRAFALPFGAAMIALLGVAGFGLSRFQAGSRRQLVYQLPIGKQLVYTLDYDNDAVSDFGALLSGSSNANENPLTARTTFHSLLKGELRVTVSTHPASGDLEMIVRIAPSQFSLVRNEVALPEQSRAIATELGYPVVIRLTSEGRVRSVRFDTRVGNVAQGFIRTVLGDTQFILPKQWDKGIMPSTWQSEEDDPNGVYTGVYKTITPNEAKSVENSEPDILLLRKTKQGYRAAPSAAPNAVAKYVYPGGFLNARFDLRAGHIQKIEGTEDQDILVAGKTVGTSKTHLEISLKQATVLTGNALTTEQESARAAQSATAIALSATPSEAESERIIQQNALGTDTAESLLARLAVADAKNGTKPAIDTDLYLKFKALIYLHPETAPKLGKLLAETKAERMTMSLLVGALAAVGSPEAQSALVAAAMGHSGDNAVLGQIIPALGGVRNPTPETVELLTRLAFPKEAKAAGTEPVATARLALGSIAHNLMTTAPERATGIVRSLIAELETLHATAGETTSQLILALGNTGSVEIVPALRKRLDSTTTNTEVRGAIITALRQITTPEVAVILQKVMEADKNESLRNEAVRSLSTQSATPEIVVSYGNVLQSDPAASVRLAILANVAQLPAAVRTQFAPILEKLSTKDPDERVRKSAAELQMKYEAQ